MCAHADSDTYFKPNGDRDADGYSNSNRYSSRNSNGHAHCHADGNVNSYRNSDSFTDVETYRYAKATPYTGAAP